MQKRGKLELTWVGKYDEKKIEPRILVEDKSKSYGDPNSENMLIHGDNLIALQALQQDYAGKIDCIYIDPPYNTGSAFEHYDDGLEHSIWLGLMRKRLKLLRELLSDSGLIFISIDNKEHPYLQVLCDEVFGRYNFRSNIVWKKVSSAKAQSNFLGNVVEYILAYSKTEKFNFYPIYLQASEEKDLKNYSHIEPETGRRYGSFDFTQKGQGEPKYFWGELIAPPKGKHWIWTQEKIDEGIANGLIFKTTNGVPRLKRYLDNKKGNFISDLWDDADVSPVSANAKESMDFFGQKSEGLIKRILTIGSKEGDLILDSFLGSGTTAAVAQKMGRRWIGVEMGNQAYTHCKKRLDSVIDGNDDGGVSKSVNWHGGGGYHFYELAPSLLVKNDKVPVYQINPEYTFEMLCEAICKIEGFHYKPDGIYHGHSSEKRFIHITKEFVNAEYVMSVAATLGEGQSLLIYSTKIQSDLRLPDNIEVKKIPKDLLDKCDFESEVR